MKLLILTSRQNFVWKSMEEIIPAIETLWSSQEQHTAKVLNVDDTPLEQILPHALTAEKIILTCFNASLGEVAHRIRKQLQIDCDFVIYLHGLSTLACWPFFEFGLDDFFRKSDLFISTCHADKKAFHLTFPDAQCEILPFSVEPLTPEEFKTTPAPTTPIPFAYVGRLAEQKNIHTLLFSYFLFKRQNPELPSSLHLYGKEDHFGSPNMGIRGGDYLTLLKILVAKLSLEDQVYFHDHVERGELSKIFAHKKHVFTSASLHSDENFGMAAFRALCQGHPAVLSAWGGHADFKEHFSDRLHLVPVRGHCSGPILNPIQFADALTLAAKAYAQPTPPLTQKAHIPKEDHFHRILETLNAPSSPTPLSPSVFCSRILARRKAKQASLPQGHYECAIFTGYDDPDAQPFFEAYGGYRPTPIPSAPPAKALLVPWVRLTDTEIQIDDPHRQLFKSPIQIPRGKNSNRLEVCVDFLGSLHPCNEETLQLLLENGYAFPL